MTDQIFPLCPLCRVRLQPIGQIPVRIGGTSGGWHLLLVNGQTSANVLCHWMYIVARSAVDWNSTTTILACRKVNV
jgi:hypothetical protein